MITMMEDNSDCKWIWDLMNVEEDTIVQGSSIANQDPCSSNKVDQGVSLWEASIINTVSNDETKIVARNSTTTNAGPWTEDEHRLFLLGLEKHGKGKWKPISVEFVKTRLPSQVASHAQKYFKRLARPARKTKRKRPSIFDIDITPVKINDDQKKSGAQVNEAKGALESGCYNIDNQLEDCWIELPSFEDDDDLPSGLFYLNKDVLQYQVIEPLMVDYNYAKLGVQVTAAAATTSDEILRLTNGTFESSCIDIDEQMKDYWLDLPTLENLPTL